MNRRALLALLTVVSAWYPAHAQESVPTSSAARRLELVERLSAVLDHGRLDASRWGVRVIKTDGAVVYERDAQKVFNPASNLKLFISAAALHRFGPDHRFRTSVYAPSRPVRGVIRGDLVFFGRGDPNISARFEGPPSFDEFVPAEQIPGIEELARQIAATGVRRIMGDLVADDSYFAGAGPNLGWEWDDLLFYYGAPVSALTVNDNAVSITVVPSAPGKRPTVEIRPPTSHVQVVNHAVTLSSGPSRPRIGADRPAGDTRIELFGTIAMGSRPVVLNLAVNDGAAFAGHLLKEALLRHGVVVTGKVRRQTAVTRVASPLDVSKLFEVAFLESMPVATLIKVVNRESQNLHAEILLRQLGVQEHKIDEYGRPVGSELLGIEALRSFLETSGVATGTLSFKDGSGLARQNLVSPKATTDLLRFMWDHPHGDAYRASLPVAGADGTLKERLRDTAADGRVQAKTGSMTGVGAISGYLETRGGEHLIFSFMANNFVGPGREINAAFDALCTLLAEFDGEL